MQDAHRLTTYWQAAGWTWACRSGRESRTGGSPTQAAAYAHGERHLRTVRRKEREQAAVPEHAGPER